MPAAAHLVESTVAHLVEKGEVGSVEAKMAVAVEVTRAGASTGAVEARGGVEGTRAVAGVAVEMVAQEEGPGTKSPEEQSRDRTNQSLRPNPGGRVARLATQTAEAGPAAVA